MDLLKKDGGFSLIETLVVILLLGLLVTFTASFFNNLFNKPELFLKNEALRIASQEIDNTINKKAFTDTAYEYRENNLFVKRTIIEEPAGYNISVDVSLKRNKEKSIVSLSAFMENENN